MRRTLTCTLPMMELPRFQATLKNEKKSRKNGLLNWLEIRKKDGVLGASSDNSNCTPSTPLSESVNFHAESRLSQFLLTERSGSTELSPLVRSDGEIPEDNFSGQETPLTSTKTVDQIDLFREQKKILSGEIALRSSALKHLSEEAAHNPKKQQILDEIRKMKEEIKVKNEQITSLEKQIAHTIVANDDRIGKLEASQTICDLVSQLNEISFDLEVKTADNQIIQDQLNQKNSQCETLQTEISSLKQQLSVALESRNANPKINDSQQHGGIQSFVGGIEMLTDHTSLNERSEKLLHRDQATEIEELKDKVTDLTETNDQLEQHNKKLAEESSYAKGLASAAAVELKALSEEIIKLMNQNERLSNELTALKNSPNLRRAVGTPRNGRRESQVKNLDPHPSPSELKRDLDLSREKELAYEAALLEKGQRESLLQRKVQESKQREANLENELANMWVLVAKLKQSQGVDSDLSEV